MIIIFPQRPHIVGAAPEALFADFHFEDFVHIIWRMSVRMTAAKKASTI